jgi:integrase
MSRESKPWYWEARKTWAVYIDGVKHILGPDKAEATRQFHNLMGREKSPQRPVGPNSVTALLDDFLTWTQENRSGKTYRGYKDYCQSFVSKYPTLRSDQLTSAEVTAWLNGQTTWNATTKRGAITALMRAFNWAVKNRGLVKNPIIGMEKPAAKTRTQIIAADEFEAILNTIKDSCFAELLKVSYDCGGRPQEVKQLEARHVDLAKQRAVLPADEAKGKKRARVIYFPTPRALEIIKRQVEKFPQGKIFRNRRGRAWSASAVKCRFARLEEKLGKRYRQYDFRHTFITRKLLAGVDSHVVATLAGHADTTMIHKVYSAVAEDHQFMLEAAMKEMPSTAGASERPAASA